MHSKQVAYAKVTFAVVAWGASFVATKVALQDVSPVTVVWLRFAMGVAILGVAVGEPRGPFLPLTADQKAHLRADLEEIDFFNKARE